MANNVLYLDPGEPYSVPAASLPASRVPTQPAASTARETKPSRQQGPPQHGKKRVDLLIGAKGAQRVPSPARVRVGKVKAAAGRWVFLPDGRQYLVPPGRAIPPGSHPLPQLLAAPERAKSNGGGILGFLEKHLVEPLEEGAPIVAPYAAASVVTAFCPECSVLAALAAGGASFGVHKGIEHEQTGAALREAVLEFMGTRAQDALKKAIGRKVDELLVRNQTAAALAVVQAALANERDYDAAVAFHHR